MTTATRTPSQRGKANGDKGKRAERAVVDAFLAAGFDAAKRAVATGTRSSRREVADPGDIAGIPRTVVSVKDTAELRLPAWSAELDRMATGAGADWALLVVKRLGNGYGGHPERWWCYMTLAQLNGLLGGHNGALDLPDPASLVCLELGPVLRLLRDELDEALEGVA